MTATFGRVSYRDTQLMLQLFFQKLEESDIKSITNLFALDACGIYRSLDHSLIGEQRCATGRRAIIDLLNAEKLHECQFQRTTTDFADIRLGTLFQTHGFMRDRKTWRKRSFSVACVVTLGIENEIEIESLIFTTYNVSNSEIIVGDNNIASHLNVTPLSSDMKHNGKSASILTKHGQVVPLNFSSSISGGEGSSNHVRDITFHLNQIKNSLNSVENLLLLTPSSTNWSKFQSSPSTNSSSLAAPSSSIDYVDSKVTYGLSDEVDRMSASSQANSTKLRFKSIEKGLKSMLNKLKMTEKVKPLSSSSMEKEMEQNMETYNYMGTYFRPVSNFVPSSSSTSNVTSTNVRDSIQIPSGLSRTPSPSPLMDSREYNLEFSSGTPSRTKTSPTKSEQSHGRQLEQQQQQKANASSSSQMIVESDKKRQRKAEIKTKGVVVKNYNNQNYYVDNRTSNSRLFVLHSNSTGSLVRDVDQYTFRTDFDNSSRQQQQHQQTTQSTSRSNQNRGNVRPTLWSSSSSSTPTPSRHHFSRHYAAQTWKAATNEPEGHTYEHYKVPITSCPTLNVDQLNKGKDICGNIPPDPPPRPATLVKAHEVIHSYSNIGTTTSKTHPDQQHDNNEIYFYRSSQQQRPTKDLQQQQPISTLQNRSFEEDTSTTVVSPPAMPLALSSETSSHPNIVPSVSMERRESSATSIQTDPPYEVLPEVTQTQSNNNNNTMVMLSRRSSPVLSTTSTLTIERISFTQQPNEFDQRQNNNIWKNDESSKEENELLIFV